MPQVIFFIKTTAVQMKKSIILENPESLSPFHHRYKNICSCIGGMFHFNFLSMAILFSRSLLTITVIVIPVIVVFSVIITLIGNNRPIVNFTVLDLLQ